MHSNRLTHGALVIMVYTHLKPCYLPETYFILYHSQCGRLDIVQKKQMNISLSQSEPSARSICHHCHDFYGRRNLFSIYLYISLVITPFWIGFGHEYKLPNQTILLDFILLTSGQSPGTWLNFIPDFLVLQLKCFWIVRTTQRLLAAYLRVLPSHQGLSCWLRKISGQFPTENEYLIILIIWFDLIISVIEDFIEKIEPIAMVPDVTWVGEVQCVIDIEESLLYW